MSEREQVLKTAFTQIIKNRLYNMVGDVQQILPVKQDVIWEAILEQATDVVNSLSKG